ncbi:MAG: TcfC E-set like domain-containing protein [Pseudomonadota bacterium]
MNGPQRAAALLIVALAASLSALADTTPALRAIDGVPAGFEHLTEMQLTEADVFFLDGFRISAFVNYNHERVEILDVAAVVATLPGLKNPTLVAEALAGELPSGAERLCHAYADEESCGRLTPDVAGVLFDEGRFRLDVFVHPDQLELLATERTRYLPAPDASWSLVNDVSMSAGGGAGSDRLAAYSTSTLARGRARVRSNYGITNQGAQLRMLSWERDFPDHLLEIGSTRALGTQLSFIGERDLLGVRFARTLNSRVDVQHASASVIPLFLPVPARVDVFRGDELIDSRHYAAGNQHLITERLPDGAYQVLLRITDVSGQVTEESHFFVREQGLPLAGEPLYAFEAGTLLRDTTSGLPELSGDHWFRASGARRINDVTALSAEFASGAGSTTLSGGVQRFAQGWSGLFSALAGFGGEYGVSTQVFVYRQRFNFSLNAQLIGGAEDRFVAAPLRNVTQVAATLGFRAFGGGVQINARHFSFAGRSSTDAGFTYRNSLRSFGPSRLDLVTAAGVGSRGNWMRVGLTWNGRREDSSYQVLPQAQYDFDTGFDPLLSAAWQRERQTETLNATHGAYLQQDSDTLRIGSRNSVFARHGVADADVGYQRGRDFSGAVYAINSRFSLVTRDGATSLGGGAASAAAVVVRIAAPSGVMDDVMFEVRVDGRRAGIASVNRPGVISLRPYASYEVSVAPLGDRLVGFDETEHSITLYPGTVERLYFGAAPLRVLIGRAVTAGGEPVANALVKNAIGFGVTDADGWFQVEVDHAEPLQLESGNLSCTLAVPFAVTADGLQIFDDLVCDASATQERPSA